MTFHYRYRKQIIISVLIIILLVIISSGGYIYYSNNNKEEPKELVLEEKEPTIKKEPIKKSNETKEIMVDIKGFVNTPGIYKLKEDSRVIDAINIAGGLKKNADTSVLNLSKKLKDEMVIIVYSFYQVENFIKIKEEEQIKQEGCIKGINEIENNACIKEKEQSNNLEQNSNNKQISINKSTIEELMQLEGIGESKAKSIIEYRNKFGLYKKLEELLNVKGIGQSLFDKIKENITL